MFNFRHFFICVLSSLLITGCFDDVEKPNRAPEINGFELSFTADQIVNENTSVTITANASDSGGRIEKYLWQVEGQESVELGVDNKESLTFTTPEILNGTSISDRTYNIILSVTDNDGATISKTLKLQVEPINFTPIIETLPHTSVVSGETIRFSPKIADQNSEDILTFNWLPTKGLGIDDLFETTVTDSEFEMIAPNISSETSYEFELTVNDGYSIAKQRYLVTVKPNTTTQKPLQLTNPAILPEDLIYVGSQLTASFQYINKDTSPVDESAFIYQWFRGSTPIPLATNTNYIPIQEDVGHAITLSITPVTKDELGQVVGETVTTSPVFVQSNLPAVVDLQITGQKVAGETLTAEFKVLVAGTETKNNFDIEWIRAGTIEPISYDVNYLLTLEDIGQKITVTVTPKTQDAPTINGLPVNIAITGITNATPEILSISMNPGTNDEPPIISQTLTGNFEYFISSDQTDIGNASTFEWFRGNDLTNPISRAKTYTTTLADVGEIVTLKITPVSRVGNITGLPIQTESLVIQNVAPIISHLEIIDQNGDYAMPGDWLTANYDFEHEFGDADHSNYQWQSQIVEDEWTDITDANSKDYQIKEEDLERYGMRVLVTANSLTNGVAGNQLESEELEMGEPPALVEKAVYIDRNNNGITDNADKIYLYLNQKIKQIEKTEFTYDDHLIKFDYDPMHNYFTFGIGATFQAEGDTIEINFGDLPYIYLNDDLGVSKNSYKSRIYISNSNSNEHDGIIGKFNGLPIRDKTTDSNSVAITPGFNQTNFGLSPKSEKPFIIEAGYLNADNLPDTVYYENSTLTAQIANESVMIVEKNLELNITDIRIADLDFNGFQEIIVSSNNENLIYSYNNELGIFNKKFNEAPLGVGSKVEVGDLNGNKSKEISFLNGNNINIYTKFPTNNYELMQAVFLEKISAYHFTDLNFDNIKELIISDDHSTYLYVFRNGKYIKSTKIIDINNSTSINSKDFDGDGDTDIVITAESDNIILENTSHENSLQFNPTELDSIYEGHHLSRLFDYNNDGDIDILLLSKQGAELLINNSGNFSSVSYAILTGGLSKSFILHDAIPIHLDKDNDIDLYVSEESEKGTIRINSYYNSTSEASNTHIMSEGKTYVAYKDLENSGPFYESSIDLVDIDNDGDLDVLTSNSHFGFSIYLNDGAGNFSIDPKTKNLGKGVNGFDLSIGDLNFDGWKDIVVTVAEVDSLSKIFLNSPSGIFSILEESLFNDYQHHAVTFGLLRSTLKDLNNDGYLDLLVNGNGGEMVFYNTKNKKNGIFKDTPVRFTNSDSSSYFDVSAMHTVDVNNDGLIDLFASIGDGLKSSIFIQNQDGTFTQDSRYSFNDFIVIGDLDKDGDQDIHSSNTLYLNDGRGNFTISNKIIFNINSDYNQLFDMNGDGLLDLVNKQGKVQINEYFNIYPGGVDPYFSSYSHSTGSLEGISIGDIDLDGDVDLVILGDGEHKINLNTGYLNAY